MALTKLTSVDKSVAKKLLSELPIQVSTVAEMKTKSYEVGQVVETVGYYAEGDAGAAKYLVKAAQAFDGYGDHTLANGTIAVLQIGSAVNVKQFGAKGDGVTNDLEAFRAMVDVRLPIICNDLTKTYLLKATLSSEVLLRDVVGITGKSKIIFESLTSADVVTGFTVVSNGALFDGANLEVKSESTSSVLCVIVSGNNLSFTNNEFSTDSFTTEHNASIFKVDDNAQCSMVTFTDNKFNNFRYGLFSSNTFGANGNVGYGYKWSFIGNHFKNFTTDALEFNTNDLEATPANRPWRYVSVIGGSVSNKLSGVTNIAIGTDGGSYMTFSGITFDNITGNVSSATSPLHIENNTGNITVIGNMFKGCYGGIEVLGSDDGLYAPYGNITINGNSMEGRKGLDYTDAVLSIPDKNAVPSVGINLQTTSIGQADCVDISGNTVRNYDIGIKDGASRKDGLTSNNVISLCHTGIDVSSFAYPDIKDNEINNCKYMYNARGSNLLIGHNSAKNCYQLFDAEFTAANFGMTGLTWSQDSLPAGQLTNIVSGATTPIALFSLPSRMDSQITMFAAVEDALTTRDQASLSNTYDGTTMTGVKKFNKAGGSLVVSGTPFVNDGTNLQVQIFQATGSNRNIVYSFQFNGWMLFG